MPTIKEIIGLHIQNAFVYSNLVILEHTHTENILPSAQLCLAYVCVPSMAQSHACAFYSEDFPGESENVLYVSGISLEWNKLWIEPY